MSLFSNTPIEKFKLNKFDLSHTRTQSMDGGILYPCMVLELLPGSRIKTSAFPVVRLQPMLSPMYQKVAFYVFDFAVPIRILNESQEVFEKWWAATIPTETTPVAPYFEHNDTDPVRCEIGDLSDYIGLPTAGFYDEVDGVMSEQYTYLRPKLNAYFHAAYQKICTDHFRDENLGNLNDDLEPEDYKYQLTQGYNKFTDFNKLRRRAWQHDYFTSALPWVQKGPSVALPVADFEDVDVYLKENPYTYPMELLGSNGIPAGNNTLAIDDGELSNASGSRVWLDPVGNLAASTSDLSNSSLITVNALRYQLAVQHYLEANARGGTRYIELIRQHFRVESSDKRLQRAEFISASEHPVIISEVLQTSESLVDGTPQGNMAGHGVTAKGTRTSYYTAEEHTIFMRIVNIRPKTSYSQGIHRMFSRLTPLDYGDPLLANLGEQAILNKELFYTDENPTYLPETEWGYIPQFSEYKYKDDSFAGDFRGNLAYWHMGRIFRPSAPPKLNEAFIECVPTKRVFAVNTNSNHPYLANIFNNVKVWHMLSKYGVPGIKTV